MWQMNEIAELMLEAGRIALRHYEAPAATVKPDGSVVTEADREIEAYFASVIENPAEGRYLLGEETAAMKGAAYYQAGLQQELYIVDPIDGTAPYAHHVPTWGISVGYAQQGILTEGAIYLPITGELFITAGSEVYLARVPTPQAKSRDLEFRPVPAGAAATLEPGSLIAVSQALARSGSIALDNPLQALASAVMPLTYVLLGRFAAYVADVKIWDIAAGLPMLLKKGFEVRMLDGQVLDGKISADWLHLDGDAQTEWLLRHTAICGSPAVLHRIEPAIEDAG